MQVTGHGNGNDASVRWEVLDNAGNIMAKGNGNVADYAFAGIYEVTYKLVFYNAANQVSTQSCEFKFSPLPSPVPGSVYLPGLYKDYATWEWKVCGLFGDPAEYCLTQRFPASTQPYLMQHPAYDDPTVIHKSWGIGWMSFYDSQVFIAHIGAGPSEIVTAVKPAESGTQTEGGNFVFNQQETISQSPVIQAMHVQLWIRVPIGEEPVVDSANLAYGLK